MEFIPFEKVTIGEAKASLEMPLGVPTKPAFQKNWAPQRRPIAESINCLGDEAKNWVAALPEKVRPTLLAQQYPRIANRLAELWRRPLYCEDYLDALMLDNRGNRNGFPQPIAKEIANLKIHLVTHVMDRHYDVWGGRVGVADSARIERK